MNHPVLEIKQLATGYGHGTKRHTVSQGLNATLEAGTFAALFGANGVGKSTLLRTLAGLQPTLEGEVRWSGRAVGSTTPRQLARLISVVLTSRTETGSLTAGEVVETGRIPYARLLRPATEADRHAVTRALQLTGTEAFTRRPLRTLSDGERQRVFIAKALAQDTPAILLDEPTAFLDYPSKLEMLRLLRRLAHEEGKAILLSTHDVEVTLQLADTVWLLRPDGIRTVHPAAMRASKDLEAYFARP